MALTRLIVSRASTCYLNSASDGDSGLASMIEKVSFPH